MRGPGDYGHVNKEKCNDHLTSYRCCEDIDHLCARFGLNAHAEVFAESRRDHDSSPANVASLDPEPGEPLVPFLAESVQKGGLIRMQISSRVQKLTSARHPPASI